MKLILGVLLGAAVVFVLLKRKQIVDLWENRKAISAGGKLVEGGGAIADGVKDVIGGGKDLLDMLDN